MRTLSSVAFNCRVTKIVMNSGSELSEFEPVSQMSQVSRVVIIIVQMVKTVKNVQIVESCQNGVKNVNIVIIFFFLQTCQKFHLQKMVLS